MGRWAPDAAVRLESAALELFAERGYGATTVPEITARAGLTTRTFFRHFADKREVLFLRERELPSVVTAALVDVPPGLSPLAAAMHGFETATGEDFDRWRPAIAARRDVVRSDARLRERELLKSATLAGAVADGLVRHGVEPTDATLLASLAVAVFDAAVDRWLDGPDDVPFVVVLRSTGARAGRLLG